MQLRTNRYHYMYKVVSV